MSFLKSITSKVTTVISTGFDGMSFSGMLSKKYPDIDEVLETLSEMKEMYNTIDATDGADLDDNKWRPMLLTLGLLYKLQRIHDSDPHSWYNEDNIFVHDDEKELKLLNTFGYYWHFCMKIAESLRSIDNKGTGHNLDEHGNLVTNEDTFNNVMVFTGLDRSCVLFAHATDKLHVDEHCPDFSIVLLHEVKQVLIVICGTRMIPAPKMKDVFMDLYADSTQFLKGEGHMGMVIGAKNIIKNTIKKIGEVLQENPGYNIMVIGYSLGAGICQFVAMDLLEGDSNSFLPEGTEVRCISFGSPPVFKPSEDSGYKCPHIYSVVYNNDGLASASVASVTKLFMQIRAVDRLKLRRRDIMKLLWNPIPVVGGGELKDEDEDDDDDFKNKTGPTKQPVAFKEGSLWNDINVAVHSIDRHDIPCLEHPAKQVYIFKRKENDVITRRLTNSSPLSDHLRLRGAMFSHHMPWGYNELFTGHGVSIDSVDLSIMSSDHHSLYPSLSNM